MTSSAQFKTWLDANTLYQSRQRAWAGRLYNPRVTAWYPDQRPAGSLSQSYRSREKSPYEPFQGFYHHGEMLVAERRLRLVDGHEEDFRAARRNNPRAGHGRKYFRSPEEQESDHRDMLEAQKVEPIVRKNRS